MTKIPEFPFEISNVFIKITYPGEKDTPDRVELRPLEILGIPENAEKPMECETA